MSYYKHHVFVCTNKRQKGEPCCMDYDSQQARDYLKKRAKEMEIHGKGNCRINSAGCLDRCGEGPVMVVYPDETWYTWIDQEDLDEIIESHLVNGQPVERLKLPSS
jgi:(2Fe-2S) ferredoxin